MLLRVEEVTDRYHDSASLLHSQPLIHLSMPQSLFPLGSSLMVGSLSAPVDPRRLIPIPLGLLAVMLPHCSAIPTVSRLPEDGD